jgi:bifunctional non-homologous end joining protein LigD
VGYTKGKGDRGQTFGALQIAEQTDQGLHYRGKVGTGFDDEKLKEILKEIERLKEVKKPLLIGGKIVDEKDTVWIEQKMVAEVSLSMITTDQMFREPVFVRLRPDLAKG